MKYHFTNDWFKHNAKNWDKFPRIQSALEIGSYEGQSSVWIIEHMLEESGRIYCIDTWAGGEEHGGIDFDEVESRFDKNVKAAKFGYQQVFKIKDKSCKALATLFRLNETFDFIYIDGSHIAKDVLTDACMSWPMLNRGGIMVFDDYGWGNPRDILHRPKIAIDAFVNIFAEELQLTGCGAQAIVRKI